MLNNNSCIYNIEITINNNKSTISCIYILKKHELYDFLAKKKIMKKSNKKIARCKQILPKNMIVMAMFPHGKQTCVNLGNHFVIITPNR